MGYNKYVALSLAVLMPIIGGGCEKKDAPIIDLESSLSEYPVESSITKALSPSSLQEESSFVVPELAKELKGTLYVEKNGNKEIVAEFLYEVPSNVFDNQITPNKFFCQSPDGKYALLGREILAAGEALLYTPYRLNLETGELYEYPVGEENWIGAYSKLSWGKDDNIHTTGFPYYDTQDFSMHQIPIDINSLGFSKQWIGGITVLKNDENGDYYLFFPKYDTIDKESWEQSYRVGYLYCAVYDNDGNQKHVFNTGLEWRVIFFLFGTGDVPAEYYLIDGKVYFSHVARWELTGDTPTYHDSPLETEILEYDPYTNTARVIASDGSNETNDNAYYFNRNETMNMYVLLDTKDDGFIVSIHKPNETTDQYMILDRKTGQMQPHSPTTQETEAYTWSSKPGVGIRSDGGIYYLHFEEI